MKLTSSGVRAARALLSSLLVPALLALAGLFEPGSSAPGYTCSAWFWYLPWCSSAPAGGGGDGTWTTETIAGMKVHLYVPASEPRLDGGRALMVNLHGCMQSATDLRNGGNWAATADEYGMVVAIPDAPLGGTMFGGCWDYYGTSHSRTSPSRHDDNLLDLVSTLKTRTGLGIDPAQVYLTGLSSGAGESMVMGCLAPDVFAGIGLSAGPTVGTTVTQIGWVATDEDEAVETCRRFAGTHAQAFGTQLTSVVYGDADTTVAQGYNRLNAQVMATIYDANRLSTTSLTGFVGSHTAGRVTVHADAVGPRVSIVLNSGLGHAWPAGGGPGGTYVSADSIDYPAYVTEFFFSHNRRV